MGKITVETCGIEGLKIITPAVFGDERGYFTETYNQKDYEDAGIDMEFVQDNQSGSKRGVLRGLHFQINYPQDKLVRVINGEVFDVAVDLRKDSETFGQWEGFYLSAENRNILYIPKGFAHGFLALEDNTLFSYLCGERYDPESDGGIRWNDPQLSVSWPLERVEQVILSDKDAALPTLAEFLAQYGPLPAEGVP